ncbi:MAG: ABC transporter permease subunit [Lachnospiraceae bacterium]|nr:ABC transporter permease subunit [Lachnospiraceae bacterium]
MFKNKRVRQILIIGFWLILWELLSRLLHNQLILVGPTEVLLSLAALLPTGSFWLSILFSSIKIALGFISAFLLGMILGCLSFRFHWLKELLEPILLLLKSIPVASFVILALIMIGSPGLSIFISFLIVLPIIYTNTMTGLSNTEEKLLEMASVFRVSFWKKVRFLYLPPLKLQLETACKTALGMSWKSGIAAEVIGVPNMSIGEKLYMAKIYLNTPDLFAWTIVILILSAIFEWLFLKLLKHI